MATSTDKVPVPETLKKQTKSEAELKEQAEKDQQDTRKKAKATRRTIYKRAQKYESEYNKADKDIIRNKRQARENGVFYVEPQAKLAFVVRLRGIRGNPPEVNKILRLLRLRQINNATFVKISKPMLEMLRLVEPYIAWGYPNLKSVRELIYKRGFGKINGQRIPITDNKIIENHFQNQDILCIEDLVHEIYTVGPHFKEVNKFLWPFKLSNPRGGFDAKLVHFVLGGDSGNREKRINKLIRAMN